MISKINFKSCLKNFLLLIKNNIILSTVIASISFIIAISILSISIKDSFFVRTLTVKGLSERTVKADFAIWNIDIVKVGGDLINVQKSLDKDLQIIKQFLISSGFKDDEIDNSNISVRDKFAGYDYSQLKEANAIKERKNERYVINSGVVVKSDKVDLIERIYRKTGELVRKGVTLSDSYSGPSYLFKGFNSIKNEMLQDATKNALITAKKFAKDAGDLIDNIKTANQGVFSISPQNASGDWENERNYIMKEIKFLFIVIILFL